MSNLQFNRVLRPKGGKKMGVKNSAVQYFDGNEYEKIDTLVRETIQNSIDNPIDKNKPVKMVFSEILIPTNEIEFKDEMISTIDALLVQLKLQKKTKGGQIEKFIDHYTNARERLTKKFLLCLKISDYNTTGLSDSIIERLFISVGEFDDASSGGGSGGLGKFAPFGSSEINFCYYSSFNTDNEYIFYGWGDNFYHKIDDKEYGGETTVGYKDSVLKLTRPYHKGFLSDRKSLGTDIFVLGHKKHFDSNWIQSMTQSVIRNFFGSILDNKLEVEIIDKNKIGKQINKNNISDYLNMFDKNQSRNKYKEIPPDRLIVESICAFQKGKVFNSLDTTVKTDLLGECEVRIFQDDDFSNNFAFMRGPRMLIFHKKILSGDIPFSGVFCCKSEKGNNILRNIEDSKHKDWKFKDIGLDKKIKKEIKLFIDYCVKEVASHESEDSFGLSGSAIFSLGSNSKKKKEGTQTEEISDDETSIIYPKKTFKNKQTTNLKYGGVVVVDKNGRRKKKDPKKPPYKKPLEPKPTPTPGTEPRVFKVSDFEAQIFKNDSCEKEYHLFVESDRDVTIRNIFFSIPGADSISFIDSIEDNFGNTVLRDSKFKDTDNAFENIELHKGSNLFKVSTKFNNKVEIIIK